MQAGSGIEDLRRLQSITDVNEFTEDNYRDSWAWVHFLIHRRPETRDLISQSLRSQYLRALSVEGNVIDIRSRLEKLLYDPGQELQEHYRFYALQLPIEPDERRCHRRDADEQANIFRQLPEGILKNELSSNVVSSHFDRREA